MIEKIYFWLPIFFGCHCRSDRSFHYHGKQFPLCARCTGELAGIIGSLLIFWFWKPTIPIAIAFMIPLIVDGSVQRFSNYESTNIKRFITGLLFGIGVSAIIARTTVMAFQFGIEIGRTLK